MSKEWRFVLASGNIGLYFGKVVPARSIFRYEISHGCSNGCKDIGCGKTRGLDELSGKQKRRFTEDWNASHRGMYDAQYHFDRAKEGAENPYRYEPPKPLTFEEIVAHITRGNILKKQERK